MKTMLRIVSQHSGYKIIKSLSSGCDKTSRHIMSLWLHHDVSITFLRATISGGSILLLRNSATGILWGASTLVLRAISERETRNSSGRDTSSRVLNLSARAWRHCESVTSLWERDVIVRVWRHCESVSSLWGRDVIVRALCHCESVMSLWERDGIERVWCHCESVTSLWERDVIVRAWCHCESVMSLWERDGIVRV